MTLYETITDPNEKWEKIFPLEEINEFFEVDREYEEYEPYIASRTQAISNVYMKFEPKTSWHSGGYYLFTQDGKPVNHIYRTMPFSATGDLHRCIIQQISFGNLPTFEKLTIYLRESGRTKIENNTPILLKLIMGAPGKKYTLPKSRNRIPACNSCDGPILKFFVRYLSNYKKCPYCGKEEEYYWRDPKIYELEFDFNEDNWNFLEKKYGARRLMDLSDFPVQFMGTLCDYEIEEKQQLNFLKVYEKLLPNGVVGPFYLAGCHQFAGSSDYKLDMLIGCIPNDHILPARELFPKQLIYPKKAFYQF